jgi:PAS domain S-box-containing protein
MDHAAEESSVPAGLSELLLDASVDGLMAFDRECRYTAWNRQMERISGLRREQVLGRVAFEVFPFLRETGEDGYMLGALEGRTSISVARPYDIPESGRRGLFDGHYSPLYDQAGRVMGGVGVIREVTERQRAEEALRAGEERYRAFIANSSEGIWRFELDEPVPVSLPADEQIERLYQFGYLAECNDAMARMYGYEQADEIVGARLGDLLVRTDPANVEYLRAFIGSGYRLTEVESVERDRDGNPRYFSNSLVGFVADGLLRRAWGTQRDVTQRRLAEMSLRESEDRLFRAQQAARLGTWDWDIVSNRVTWSEGIYSMLGLVPGSFDPSFDRWLEFVLLEDADSTRQAVSEALARGGEFTVEFRVRRADAEVRWLAAVGRVEFGPAGTAARMLGVNIDITERRQTEEEARRLAAIIEATTDFVAVARPDGQVIYINQAGRRLVGIPEDADDAEINRAALSPAWAYERTQQEWLPAALRDGSASGEGALLTRTGEEIPVSFVLLAHRDAAGRPEYVSTIARDITERVALEEKRRASEERFTKAFHASPNPIAITAISDGRYVDVNESFLVMSGYSREEVVGRTVLDLGFWHSAEERERGTEAIRSGRPPRDTEYRFPTRTGGVRDLLASTEIVRINDEDCALTVMSDITERKRREEGQRFLAEAGSVISSSLDYETTLAAVARMAVPVLADWCAVDLTNDAGGLERLAVAHVDPDKIEWARRVHERYPPDPKAPHGVYEVLRTGRAELFPQVTDEMLSAGARDEEHLRLLRELRLSSIMIVPLAARGRTLGAITFVAAESGRRFGPEDLTTAGALSQQAAYAIDNARLYAHSLGANRLKDEFLATLSHELRTPLTAILGWSRMLAGGALDAETTRRAVEVIIRNAESQRQIVEDVLDASRIITGKLRIEPEEVDLLDAVREALDTVRPAAEAKEIELICNFDPQLGRIVGDPQRLRQVVWNLLANAVKFTERGGRVKIEAGRSLSSVRLTVSDTGQGIAPDFLPFVFERFRQQDGSTTRLHGGLGLGLSIVRHLVEAHGGSVHAYSAGAGQGASFTVELPLPAAAPQYTPGADEAGAGSGAGVVGAGEPSPVGDAPPVLLGVRVLLVEDDRDTLELLQVLLRRHGAEVTPATSADEALDALGRARPDIIVSDIGMPQVDGFELMRRVRALGPEAGGQTLAVALTAYATDADRVQAMRSGFQAHVSKPVAPETLVTTIASLAAGAGADA